MLEEADQRDERGDRRRRHRRATTETPRRRSRTGRSRPAARTAPTCAPSSQSRSASCRRTEDRAPMRAAVTCPRPMTGTGRSRNATSSHAATGPSGRDEDSRPPRSMRSERPDDPERQARAGGKRRRVERDVPRARDVWQAVGDDLEAGHVGPGESLRPRASGTPPRSRRRPPTARSQWRRRRQGARAEPDRASVDAVRKARQHRDREHVAGEVGAADPARFGVAQCPGGLQLRLQGQEHRERQHAEDLSDAEDGDDQGLLRCPVPAIASNTNSLYTPRVRPSLIFTCVVTFFMAQPAHEALTTSAIANEWLEAADAHEPGIRDAALQRCGRGTPIGSTAPCADSRGQAERAAEQTPRARRAVACGHHTSES